jgi:cation-transporting ATPase E
VVAPTETDLRPLTAAEVEARRADGRSNRVESHASRTLGEILRANVLTPFNLLIGVLLVAIIAVGELKDSLFGIVLVLNTGIGIVQEWRAKRTLDRLATLHAPRAMVRRDDGDHEVALDELVLDDLVVLRAGDQIPVDGDVVRTAGLEVDESLLTGESDPVQKDLGDELLSGAFVAVGNGAMRATRVGADTHAARLAEEARSFSLVRSELRDAINRVIRWISWLLIPAAVLVIWAQVRADLTFTKAVQGSVAGLVAMVPEGLVLLTSVAFAVGAARLARRKVLTQELAAIEGLARVDIVCVDKTGTLTEGQLTVATVEPVDGSPADDDAIADALAALARADEHPNPSLAAVGAAHDHDPGWTRHEVVPFSSARKWSAATFDGQGSWLLGAPDVLLTRADQHVADTARAAADAHARQGRRVLLVARAPDGLRGNDLPPRVEPAALVVLDEQIRASAPDTIAYFAAQGVRVKVISGDSPTTVAAVARSCGIEVEERAVDARSLDDDMLADAVEHEDVFGRVTPQQKQAMVHALQARGHVVAMTGDGVNDTLALKDADVGVAMGAGSPAARAVARFVLLDNDFAVFPHVVDEGRRVIANIERVANLFLTKTTYALLLAVAVGISGWAYPFIPRHYTMLSGLTIGIPAFFLALAPNARRAEPHFLERVLRFSVPCGLIAGAAAIVSYAVAQHRGLVLAEQRTAALISIFIAGWWVLAILARPLRGWRLVLVAAMGASLPAALALPVVRHYFELSPLHGGDGAVAVVIGAVAAALIELAWRTGRLTPRG